MPKSIRIIETGETFPSTHAVAACLGVTPGAVVHCLKGRQKRVKGVTLEYCNVTFKRSPAPHRLIYDDNGKLYNGYVSIGVIWGITANRARYLTLRGGGIFRTRCELQSANNDLFGPIEGR